MSCGQNFKMKLSDHRFWKKSINSSDLISLNYAQAVFRILNEGDSVMMDPKFPLPVSSWKDIPSLQFKTSGTSSKSKKIILSWEALNKASQRLESYFNLDEPINTISSLPIHHVGGWMQVMRAWFSSGSVLFVDYKDLAKSEKLNLCDNRFISLVPSQLYELLKSENAIAHLRRCRGIFVGGAHCSSEIAKKAREAELPIYLCYGMTETAGMVAVLDKDDFANGISGVGQPMQGVSMRLDSEGRICIKCPSIGFAEVGSVSFDQKWFVTSDLGKEKNGYWEVLHRVDRLINTGGEKVNPDLVEKNILEFPSVKSCLVSSEKDEKWVEKVVAYVTPKSICSKGLRLFLEARLKKHEVPKNFYTIDTIQDAKSKNWKH